MVLSGLNLPNLRIEVTARRVNVVFEILLGTLDPLTRLLACRCFLRGTLQIEKDLSNL